MSGSKLIFPIFILLMLLLTFISLTKNENLVGEDMEFIKGVSLVAPVRELTEDPIPNILQIHANWVAIMPFAFINGNSSQIIFDNEHQWWGEKSNGVIKTIELAKKKGLMVMLKPHIWVKGQGWAGDFSLESEADWKEWENNYDNYILHFAQIADSMNVEAFCIGLELRNVVKNRPKYWPKLIKKVRECYRGKITYAANWDNYHHVKFWDKVDFIGINAYFPLSQENTPSTETLKFAWEEEKKSLLALSKRYEKPIVFTEYGYRSIDKAAGNQWELADHRNFKGEVNFQSQVNAYSALFDTFWDEPEFKGGFLWKWYPYGNNETDPDNSDYTPQKKTG